MPHWLLGVPRPKPAAAQWVRSPLLWAQPQVYMFAWLRTSEREADFQVAHFIRVVEAKMMGFFPSHVYSLISWFFLYSWRQTIVSINSFFLPSDSYTYRPTTPKQKYNLFLEKRWLLLPSGTDWTPFHFFQAVLMSCKPKKRERKRGSEALLLFISHIV